MMTQPDSASLTWEIKNFANANFKHRDSLEFETKQEDFCLRIYPKDHLPNRRNYIVIYLYRDETQTTDVEVLWTISLINDKGEECYFRAIETKFTAEGEDEPISGGLYHLDRDTILEPSSGLLPGGKLIVKCTFTVLDEQNSVKPLIEDKTITLAHKKSRENYQSFLESSKLSDVVFVVGKKQCKLHKAILASQSPVFLAMFDADLEEAKKNRVDIIDVNVKVFEAMVRFIYTGNVDLVNQHALDLFVAADKYQLDSLKDICAQSLVSNLTIESVANILMVADTHNEAALKSKCVQYINKNVSKVMVTEGWKLLVKERNSVDLLHELYRDIVAKTETFMQ